MSSEPGRPRQRSLQRQLVLFIFGLLMVVPLVILFREFGAMSADPAPPISTRTIDYRGWAESIVMESSRVEVIIVPAIGRVMQFRFKGEEGPFWENEALWGKSPDAASPEWGNFGGDKTWPSPQSKWPLRTPRAWPPPPAFDSMPVKAEVRRGRVTLLSPVDPDFGIRTEREIRLDADHPRMTIITTYEQVTEPSHVPPAGGTNRVGIWIITQLSHPEAVFIPVGSAEDRGAGYVLQSDTPPLALTNRGGLLSLARDPSEPHKIGTRAGTLLWVGARETLRIDSPRIPGAPYPDDQSSAEVYTSRNPASYVELEMLAPLQEMKVGQRYSQTNVYTLARRTEPTPEAEALKLLRP